MGRTPTRVLLHLALLYFFIPPAAGGGGGGLTAKASGSKGIDCSAAVRPVDAVPLRSPQAVHSVLASEYFAGKHIVEIGTPIVINEGLHAVRAMKEAFPHLQVLADLSARRGGRPGRRGC